ncbi:hypothetical protein [Cytobacillus massiliigabonensis]|uniref:hypothetical protein n=1 Tax=Cytobacillus massiliigabonensis TaxID=1871011 RepID=UPI000C847259|nr:hypothetical protein [Cytobacillus massiliigabonensis]
MEIKRDLFVVANVDKDGNVVSYPQGGGSSTLPSIRAFGNPKSAKRSSARLGGKVLRITGFEVVE